MLMNITLLQNEGSAGSESPCPAIMVSVIQPMNAKIKPKNKRPIARIDGFDLSEYFSTVTIFRAKKKAAASKNRMRASAKREGSASRANTSPKSTIPVPARLNFEIFFFMKI